MDWLPIASVIGLTVAVVVLGWTVVTQAVWNKRQQGPSMGEQVQQEQLDASKDGSIRVKETGSLPTQHQVGFRSPKQAFREAYMSGNTQFAIAVLPELKRVLGAKHPEYLLSASVLAAAGEQVDLQSLLDAITSNAVSDESVLQAVITGTVQHYVSTNNEQDGLEKTKDVLDLHVLDTSRSQEFRAHIANQLNMLYFGAGDTDNALKEVNLAIKLFPEEPSYYFNLSLIHERRENLRQAIEAIECCIEKRGDPPDVDHLYQAWDLYRQTGNERKMKATQDRIDAVRRQP